MAALGTAPTGDRRAPGRSRPRTPERPAHARRWSTSSQTIAAMLPTGSQPALDDDPESYTPAGQTAKAARAERLARDIEARRRTIRRRVLPVALLVVLALAAWLIGVAVGKLPGHSGGAPATRLERLSRHRSAKCSPWPPSSISIRTETGRKTPPTSPSPTTTTSAPRGPRRSTTETQWGGTGKSGVGLKVDLGKPVAVIAGAVALPRSRGSTSNCATPP